MFSCQYSSMINRSRRSCRPILQISRGIRTKRRTANIDEDIRRQELWHRKLQADLVKAKVRLREEEGNMVQRWWNKPTPNDDEPVGLLDDINPWYWNHVLTKEERKRLEKYEINDLDGFSEIYGIAKADEVQQVPHPQPLWDKYLFIIDTYEDARKRLLDMEKKMHAPSKNLMDMYSKSQSN